MPINSAPVDQTAFGRIMLVGIEPRMAMERGPDGQMKSTGVQFTSKDGTEKKWTVHVAVSLPSKWDANRTEHEVLPVTVTCADDPIGKVHEGEQVWFSDLTVGVMPPEQSESGKIRGGKLFWQASGVQSRVGKRGES